MKIRGLFKKAAATLMAAVTALSILPATTAFAAGDIGTISFSHTYDSSGNAMRYNSSATFDGHTAGGTGNYKYRMFVDGENAFCIQPGVPLNTGNTLKKASSDTWNALSANQKKAVGLALLYGYQGNRSNLTGSDDEKWVATQTLVWEFVTGCREATGSFSKTSDKVYSLHFGSNYANSGAKAAYDQIVSLMSEHHTIPSFMSGSKNGITKELAYKDGKYTLTFTDSNGVLSDYAFSSSDSKVSVSKSGNKLTISSAKAFDGTVRITATRNNMPIVSSSAKLIAYGDPNLQDLVTGVENADTVAAYINVETPTGTIALKKTSEDGIVEGIQFTIKGKDFNQTVKTDKNGNITVAGLVPDIYTITEQAIDKYEPQQTQTVTLIGGKTTTVTFSNVLKRGSLEVVKTSEDNLVESVKFHLYGTSLSGYSVDEYAVTNAKGVAKFENVLISGNTPYTLEEVDTAIRYVVPASQTAPIEWNKVTNRSFHNILKKFNVTVTKTDAETGKPQGDASLAGAVYGIYKGEELIDTYTTDANGQFTTKYYICAAYLTSDTKYPVNFKYAGQETATVHITANEGNAIENKLIYGSVSGKKSDEDGKALGGAVIGIFKVGTTEFTKENAIKTTTSADDGSFSFAKVPYGTWAIREIESPKGFVLSEEEIPVTIGKVDEVVEIELVNFYITGKIELTKVDEDYPENKLTGAVFEVYADKNGDGKLDKDDELLGTMGEVEKGVYQMGDLRYGKYLVREKTAPEGFVLDEGVYGVSIEENGKTYAVENKAGVGFINTAQKGSLKIVKTSSNGKLEGFSFRVTGTDYDQTFKTDKNGEIFIEGLRIGEYTVSEVSDNASAGYILPADKQATVKVGATTIVQMHNELRDTPKTGDDFNPALWVSLAAVSLIGAGVLGIVGFKGRKKKKED